MAKILIVDDQPMILNCLKAALTADGHDISTVSAGDLALKLVGFTTYDVIITDYAMPRMDGLTFLETAQTRSPGVPVIMITGHGTADTAMDAMVKGAFDYLTKPFSLEALRTTVGAAVEYVKARKDSSGLTHPSPELLPYPQIVAASPAMVATAKRIDELRRVNVPVLIQGEPGTGKETIARTLHAQGLKKPHAFEKVECLSLAKDEPIGRLFAAAEGGSVFFREVGAISPSVQDQLLRVLLTATYELEPGSPPLPLTARILASTCTPLEPLAASKNFNPDLLGMLTKNTLVIPPLRHRPEDVRAWIGLLLSQTNGKAPDVAPIEPDALLILEHYPWPGNLPELTEAIRTATIMSRGGQIGVGHLPREIVSHVHLAGEDSFHTADLNQFRGRVVKSFLQNMKKEYGDIISKIDGYEG
jgi:DNA-binding NtrC family response regulator